MESSKRQSTLLSLVFILNCLSKTTVVKIEVNKKTPHSHLRSLIIKQLGRATEKDVACVAVVSVPSDAKTVPHFREPSKLSERKVEKDAMPTLNIRIWLNKQKIFNPTSICTLKFKLCLNNRQPVSCNK